MGGILGTYSGHEVWQTTIEEYFEHKSEYDNKDVMYLLTVGTLNPLVHRGIIICFLTNEVEGFGHKVVPVKQRKTIEQWLQETGRPMPRTSKDKDKDKEDAKKRGNPTCNASHEVTKRYSVDYYLRHTIEVLNEGIKYGERRLQEQVQAHDKR